jgi:ABC-2 type transport system ATP-binding protein
MNIIETRGLTRRFWRTEAVRDLHLSIEAGTITALLGANGAGKSTTLKMLMNLLNPTSGSAQVLGVDSRRLGEKERACIGYIAEGQSLPMWMTVRQLLDYCRPFYPTWDRNLEAALLQQFDLPVDRPLKNLSRGMVMKAALVSTLSYRPKLLLLDEPFSGLDPVVRDEFVQGLLTASSDEGWTVVVSSHDVEEVERLADNVVFLDRGRLRFSESAESLQRRFRRVEVSGAGITNAAPLPTREIGWTSTGALLHFITTAYRGDDTEVEWRGRFPDAVISTKPMTLREVFVAIEKAERLSTKGVSV